MNSTPSVLQKQSGALMVFACGPDNSMYVKYQHVPNDTTWGGWDTLGGNLIIH